MELLDAIRTRRTARVYESGKISAELISSMLEQAAAAPSACNRRGWRFILLEERDDLDWLYRRGGSAVLRSAEQALLVCYQRETDNSAWDDNIQSAAAIVAYFQLIAHDQGIGSCWICHLPSKRELASYFKIPDNYTPVALVTIGYYKKSDSLRPRVITSEDRLLAISRWDFNDDIAGGVRFQLLLRKLLRSIYYKIPFRGVLRGVAGRFEKKFDNPDDTTPSSQDNRK